MKHPILLSLLILPLLANAEDPYCRDPEAYDPYASTLKPLTGLTEDITLKPLEGLSSRRRDDSRELRTKECQATPEDCVIKTYGITPFGTPDTFMNPAKSIIEYDASRGQGKVFETDSFGKKALFSEQKGTVKKDPLSGDLLVYETDRWGNVASDAKPVQIISGDHLSARGDCHRTQTDAKIYEPDSQGERGLFAKPVGAAVVECEK